MRKQLVETIMLCWSKHSDPMHLLLMVMSVSPARAAGGYARHVVSLPLARGAGGCARHGKSPAPAQEVPYRYRSSYTMHHAALTSSGLPSLGSAPSADSTAVPDPCNHNHRIVLCAYQALR